MRRFLRLVPDDDGEIPPRRWPSWRAIVAAHVRTASAHGVREVRVVGTAAIRGARNRDDLCAAVHAASPASMSRSSAASRRRRWPSPGRWPRWRARRPGAIGVIDVGGGSSRARDRDRARRRHVVGVAADRLRDAGRAPPALRSAARSTSSAACAPRSTSRWTTSTRRRPRCVLAVGGSATTLAAAAGGELVPATIARILAVLLAEPASEAAKRLGLPSSACACCRWACWRSRRPGERSARRLCRSRWAACARALSCGHSTVVVEWWAADGQSARHPGAARGAELPRGGRAATVAVRTQELFDHAEGVLDTSDIERVHDMRVATRRLRAVLEIYEPCFPRKALRDVLDDVKALADALGERRDPDVHLAQLEEFARRRQGGRPPGRRGLRRARPRRAGRRQRGAGRRAGRDPGDRPARPARSARRERLARARPAAVVRSPAAATLGGGAMKARAVKGLDPDAHAGRQPRADGRHAPGRAVLVRAAGARPVAHEGAARHAHRGQAPALHPRGRRRAVLRPLRRDRDQAHQGPAGPARRAARLRRPAPARARAAGRAARRRRAGGARPRRRRARPRPDAGLGDAARARRGAASRRCASTSRRAAGCCSSASWRCGASSSARASARAWSTRSASAPSRRPRFHRLTTATAPSSVVASPAQTDG